LQHCSPVKTVRTLRGSVGAPANKAAVPSVSPKRALIVMAEDGRVSDSCYLLSAKS
jgi:hypothetical protein